MNKIEMSILEKEMIAFDITALHSDILAAEVLISSADSVEEMRSRICVIWGKLRKFIKIAENIPVTGKYISLLSSLLDAICSA